jgi:hypothetical protein
VRALNALRSRDEIPSVLLAGASTAFARRPHAALFIALLVFVTLPLVRSAAAARGDIFPETADA